MHLLLQSNSGLHLKKEQLKGIKDNNLLKHIFPGPKDLASSAPSCSNIYFRITY